MEDLKTLVLGEKLPELLRPGKEGGKRKREPVTPETAETPPAPARRSRQVTKG